MRWRFTHSTKSPTKRADGRHEEDGLVQRADPEGVHG